MNETQMLEKVLKAISRAADDRATSSGYAGMSYAYRYASEAIRDVANEVLHELTEGQQ